MSQINRASSVRGSWYTIQILEDPTLVNTDAPPGTVGIKVTSPIGVYQKRDDGNNTNWDVVAEEGAGAGFRASTAFAMSIKTLENAAPVDPVFHAGDVNRASYTIHGKRMKIDYIYSSSLAGANGGSAAPYYFELPAGKTLRYGNGEEQVVGHARFVSVNPGAVLEHGLVVIPDLTAFQGGPAINNAISIVIPTTGNYIGSGPWRADANTLFLSFSCEVEIN